MQIKAKRGLLQGGVAVFLAQLSPARRVEWEALIASGMSESAAHTSMTAGEDHSICMILEDVHVDDAGTVFVLAGRPHPDADYGHTQWNEFYLYEGQEWSRPWTDDCWITHIHDTELEERAEAGETCYEVHFAQVLSFCGDTWQYQNLPGVGMKFYDLRPEMGLVLTSSHGGLMLYEAGKWVAYPLAEQARERKTLDSNFADEIREIRNAEEIEDIAVVEGRVMARTSSGRVGHLQKEGDHLTWHAQHAMGKPAVDLELGPDQRLWRLEADSLFFSDDGLWWDPVRFR